MDCREFHETFSDYVDAVLDAAAAARARRHLAACAACRRFESAYRVGVTALQALPALAPPRDYGARTVNRARSAPAGPGFAEPLAVAASLAALALIGFLVADLGRLDPAPRDAATAAGSMDQPPEAPSRADERTDFVTVRIAQGDDIPYGSPYPAFQATDSFSAVRVRFDVPAVWSGR